MYRRQWRIPKTSSEIKFKRIAKILKFSEWNGKPIFTEEKKYAHTKMLKNIWVIGNTAKGKTGFLRMENAVIDMHIN